MERPRKRPELSLENEIRKLREELEARSSKQERVEEVERSDQWRPRTMKHLSKKEEENAGALSNFKQFVAVQLIQQVFAFQSRGDFDDNVVYNLIGNSGKEERAKNTPSNTASGTPTDILNKFTDVVCSTCNKGIEGKIVSALGKTWHPEHFSCSNCKKAITGDRFNQDKGSPYCEDCYASKFLRRCYKCSLPIKEKIIVALEKSWHQEHFTCNDCNVELTGLSFFEKDNLAYCQNCHMQKFAPKCKECNRPITDTAIMALGDKWHQNCFQCSICNRPVTETTFEVVENRPLCSTCSRLRK